MLQMAAAAVAAPPPWQAWQSGFGLGHPLAGRVLDVSAGGWITPRELRDRLQGVRYVVLGEQHDNADHHRLQAWLVDGLALRGRRPAVAFEMLAADQQEAVNECLESCRDPLTGLPGRVAWSSSGWPPWKLYRPVFAAAIGHDLPLVAAGVPRAAVRAITGGGGGELDEGQRRALALDEPIPHRLGEDMKETLRESHCGYAPEASLPAMVRAQWARDAFMAKRLQERAAADGAVLIAGNGHARRDWGVPRRLEDGTAVVSLAMLEVRDGETGPAGYLPAAGGGSAAPAWDYVWFTPRTDDRDPCERFRDQLRGMGGAAAGADDAGRGAGAPAGASRD